MQARPSRPAGMTRSLAVTISSNSPSPSSVVAVLPPPLLADDLDLRARPRARLLVQGEDGDDGEDADHGRAPRPGGWSSRSPALKLPWIWAGMSSKSSSSLARNLSDDDQRPAQHDDEHDAGDDEHRDRSGCGSPGRTRPRARRCPAVRRRRTLRAGCRRPGRPRRRGSGAAGTGEGSTDTPGQGRRAPTGSGAEGSRAGAPSCSSSSLVVLDGLAAPTMAAAMPPASTARAPTTQHAGDDLAVDLGLRGEHEGEGQHQEAAPGRTPGRRRAWAAPAGSGRSPARRRRCRARR